jgi:hypothetical protein
MKGEIRFKVQDMEEIKKYAQEKGFIRVGDLARFALYQYMTRYKGVKNDAKYGYKL